MPDKAPHFLGCLVRCAFSTALENPGETMIFVCGRTHNCSRSLLGIEIVCVRPSKGLDPTGDIKQKIMCSIWRSGVALLKLLKFTL